MSVRGIPDYAIRNLHRMRRLVDSDPITGFPGHFTGDGKYRKY